MQGDLAAAEGEEDDTPDPEGRGGDGENKRAVTPQTCRWPAHGVQAPAPHNQRDGRQVNQTGLYHLFGAPKKKEKFSNPREHSS